jgi:ABC-type multidrug transport system permease subunit
MYRVNPLTYMVSSFLSGAVGEAPMRCADNEILSFAAPAGMTCQEYMRGYMSTNPGYLLDSGVENNGACQFCTMENTKDYLEGLNIQFSNRWRDFGLLWVYIVVNTIGAIVFYKLFRVPRSKKGSKRQ